MTRKREILELLSADELRELVDRFELEVKDRRARDGMIDTLSRSHRAQLGEPLADDPRDRLKERCRKLDLDDSGKEKAPIVDRLLGRSAAPEEDEADTDGGTGDEPAADPTGGADKPVEAPAKRGRRTAKLLSGELRIREAEKAVEAVL